MILVGKFLGTEYGLSKLYGSRDDLHRFPERSRGDAGSGKDRWKKNGRRKRRNGMMFDLLNQSEKICRGPIFPGKKLYGLLHSDIRNGH